MLSSQSVPTALRRVRIHDAVDHLDRPLGALRAIEALTECYKADSELDLPHLRRPDLAHLLALVANDLEHIQGQAKDMADSLHQVIFPQPATATQGDEA